MDHESVLVTANIEDSPIVQYEINVAAELYLDIGRAGPDGIRGERIPKPYRRLGLRVTLPELAEGPEGDHLHARLNRPFPNWEQEAIRLVVSARPGVMSSIH